MKEEEKEGRRPPAQHQRPLRGTGKVPHRSGALEKTQTFHLSPGPASPALRVCRERVWEPTEMLVTSLSPHLSPIIYTQGSFVLFRFVLF